MSLTDEYTRQRRWRRWSTILESLPSLAGRMVLDLGCGVGDQAAELAARGAKVIGVDLNAELLAAARARAIAGARFLQHDIRELPDFGVPADGIWSSFAAAYLPDPVDTLRSWSAQLTPGGWIALTEIDDLFGHEPLSAPHRAILDEYAREALASKRYDFFMGRKLEAYLRDAGFAVVRTLYVDDDELSFAGPAPTDVLEAWRARLDRLKGLRDVAGGSFDQLRDELLACLTSPEHRSTARVVSCIAVR